MTCNYEALLDKILMSSIWYEERAFGVSSEYLSDLVSSGKLFSLRQGCKTFYPAYAFDKYQKPLPVIEKVLEVFNGKKTDVKIAAWFASANGYLRNKRPLDIIATHPQAVIAAAKDEIMPIEHG